MRQGLLSFIATGFRFLWIQNTFLFRNYWATAARRQKVTFFAEVTLAIGWRVVFLMLVPSWSALALLVVGFLAGAFFTAYWRSEEHTSELQSLMRISYAVFCLKKKNKRRINNTSLLLHMTIDLSTYHHLARQFVTLY